MSFIFVVQNKLSIFFFLHAIFVRTLCKTLELFENYLLSQSHKFQYPNLVVLVRDNNLDGVDMDQSIASLHKDEQDLLRKYFPRISTEKLPTPARSPAAIQQWNYSNTEIYEDYVNDAKIIWKNLITDELTLNTNGTENNVLKGINYM